MFLGGTIMTFALPMAAFIVIAGATVLPVPQAALRPAAEVP